MRTLLLIVTLICLHDIVSSFYNSVKVGGGNILKSSNNNNNNNNNNCCDDKVNCETAPLLRGLIKIELHGEPSLTELTDENIVKIVNLEATDTECNYIAWKCLGYRYNNEKKIFEGSENVFPKWLTKYPNPPDIIGIKRDYRPEIDKEVRNASMDLMRSIPRDYKGGVRQLESIGWKGYKLAELTPNKTRRAQLCNWLIYYREKLFGKTLEQLKEEREKEKEKNIADEVANLPSEKMYQKLRLD